LRGRCRGAGNAALMAFTKSLGGKSLHYVINVNRLEGSRRLDLFSPVQD
jgi:hypothetical protein